VVRDRNGEVLGAVEVFRKVEPGPRECADPEGDPGGDARTRDGLDGMMQALGRGVAIVDEGFELRHVSARLAELTGYAPSSLEGRPAQSLLGEELCGESAAFRAGLVRGELQEGYRAALCHADGSTVGASVTGAPLARDPLCDGESPGFAGYLLVVRPDGRRSGDGRESQDSAYEGMVARSHAMQQIFQLIGLLGESDASVLVTGESGTGKELVARAIHARSHRRDRPFVAVNCGALPGELLESELFGHARGAFTGAVRDKPGRFEVVEDGTIFLDEIGDMPLELQVKLLRVLQERTFERVGETTTREVSARVVAATHQDLARLVAERRFREDLYYRLNVVPIHVPPLRDRRQDVEPLVFHILDRIGSRRGRTYRLSPGVLRRLLAQPWPGNVRQLENALEYATTICEGETLHERDLPPELGTGRADGSASEDAAAARSPEPVASPKPDEPTVTWRPEGEAYPTRHDVEEALRATRHRRAAAAELLGISRTTLWRRMREHGLG
jgi:PAS domain S-box-containing protein